ncbi:3-(3-hydroxyphenyl)propionate hydroxylase [Pseudomonas aeruginosa]|nr:3-(3-hydroxyphenyl)propionate hydroxylase [Pseudomonas aeruginosa]MBK3907212.1 3-(3-hydroxyphenyl)propionate hydroxylase [Pseudomonas aeruginosa]MCO1748544.1 3-(3-hydroxyphenyl)propionate hydroxylase [Pseudomonas aeruginosa]MCO2626883.1 3-(3-hydroxyphenyl)propionate hydroxylase [Pseudomonas aeruginosa]MCO3722474.1 3-(3-hydroxyphenyl)propionate hydroxylase [Pseudomonas aeruginosa]
MAIDQFVPAPRIGMQEVVYLGIRIATTFQCKRIAGHCHIPLSCKGNNSDTIIGWIIAVIGQIRPNSKLTQLIFQCPQVS